MELKLGSQCAASWNSESTLSRSMECDYRRGFELDIGFIDRFNTQLITTLNYGDIAISTLHKVTLSLFQLAMSSLVVAW
jgi:hypothetical protein